MQRKLFLVVQGLVLLLFSSAIGVAAASRPSSLDSTFTDVPTSNTFYEFINNISDADISHGYTNPADCPGVGAPCYKPANNVTRGQMAAFIDLGRRRPGVVISTTADTTPWDTLPLISRTGNVNGTAIFGAHTALTGVAPAIIGASASNQGAVGVQGIISSTSAPAFSAGVKGTNHGASEGIGVWGEQLGAGWGVYGTVAGPGKGVVGIAPGAGIGVYGQTDTGVGVYGTVANSTQSTAKAVFGVAGGFGSYGVFGSQTGTGFAVNGEAVNGAGVRGVISAGGTGDGIHGIGLPVAGNRWAGTFEGKIKVTGSCTGCLLATYSLDDPRDPANRVISQAAVASPDYMNIYNGNVTTDANGEATVQLPDYFETINSDYRYQLTVVGQLAQAYIAQEIKGNSFVVKTDKPNVKISWQVTGIRSDAVAKANPVQDAAEKSAQEKGYYLNPELYGQPYSKSVEAVRGLPQPNMESLDQQARAAQK